MPRTRKAPVRFDATFALEEALAQAVRELRATYPDSSYNCMIQSQDQFIALRAESGRPTAQAIVDI